MPPEAFSPITSLKNLEPRLVELEKHASAANADMKKRGLAMDEMVERVKARMKASAEIAQRYGDWQQLRVTQHILSSGKPVEGVWVDRCPFADNTLIEYTNTTVVECKDTARICCHILHHEQPVRREHSRNERQFANVVPIIASVRL